MPVHITLLGYHVLLLFLLKTNRSYSWQAQSQEVGPYPVFSFFSPQEAMIVSEYYLSAQTTSTVWTSAEDFHSQEKMFHQRAKETFLLIFIVSSVKADLLLLGQISRANFQICIHSFYLKISTHRIDLIQVRQNLSAQTAESGVWSSEQWKRKG